MGVLHLSSCRRVPAESSRDVTGGSGSTHAGADLVPALGAEVIDAVLSYQTNPLMGGVAAFNHQLAKRLSVPCLQIGAEGRPHCAHPLLSLKTTELPVSARIPVEAWKFQRPYSLFLHAVHARPTFLLQSAARVFAANAEVAEQIRPVRPDVITAHCPGLIEHRGAFPTSDLTVFSFGHGHKLRVDLYAHLKALLDATGKSYTVYLSAGLHTGAQVADDPFLALERLFGDALVFLGILSDRAVAHYLATSTYVACFFEHGVRANNTTVNAALDVGAVVVTNCDDWTPALTRAAVVDLTDPAVRLHPMHLIDVPGMFDTEGPWRDPRPAREAAAQHAAAAHSWDRLLELLR